MSTITTPNWDRESWIASEAYIDYAANLLSHCLTPNPNNRFLDIGCGRGQITTKFTTLHPFPIDVEGIDASDVVQEHSFKVDGSPIQRTDKQLTDKHRTNKRVIFTQTDALHYLQAQQENRYDGIILKQIFHLIDPHQRAKLLKQIYRTLKPTGRALILQMTPESAVPLCAKGRALFLQELYPVDEVIELGKNSAFSIQLTDFNFPVSIEKNRYFELLRQRFMSNLRSMSDSEIESGIEHLNSKHPEAHFTFNDSMKVIHLVK